MRSHKAAMRQTPHERNIRMPNFTGTDAKPVSMFDGKAGT